MNKEKLAKLKKVKKAQWNEENLQENDIIKASMTFTKIEEPKTPYHSHLEVSDDVQDEIDHIPTLEMEKIDEITDEKEEYEETEVVHDPDFEKKRRAHYNEFQMKGLLKRKYDDEEEDEDEDEKEVTPIIKV
jgi:hypothetical protein